MNLNKLLLLRRKFRHYYYSHYNKFALKLSGAYIGDNFTSLGKIHLDICKGAVLTIGNSSALSVVTTSTLSLEILMRVYGWRDLSPM